MRLVCSASDINPPSKEHPAGFTAVNPHWQFIRLSDNAVVLEGDGYMNNPEFTLTRGNFRPNTYYKFVQTAANSFNPSRVGSNELTFFMENNYPIVSIEFESQDGKEPTFAREPFSFKINVHDLDGTVENAAYQVLDDGGSISLGSQTVVQPLHGEYYSSDIPCVSSTPSNPVFRVTAIDDCGAATTYDLKYNIAMPAVAGVINIDSEANIQKKTVDFVINLASPDSVDRWGCFRVTIDAPGMNLYGCELTNTLSNRFKYSLQLPRTLSGGLEYTINVYSRRTGELLSRSDHYIDILTPLTITAQYDGDEVLCPGDSFNLSGIKTNCPVSVTSLNAAIYRDGTRVSGEIQFSNPRDITRVWGDDTFWRNISGFIMPEGLEDGMYTVRITATAENGVTAQWKHDVSVQSFKITGVTIEGYWNHWRGQVDMFGKQLADEPHRFLSLEKVKVTVHTTGYADKVAVRFSPELEAMQYTDPNGYVYDYKDDFFGHYVYFPDDSTFTLDTTVKDNSIQWEYSLPLAPSTKSWGDERLRSPYTMTVTAYKGGRSATWAVEDIDITGNVYNLTYIQPR